ncbi:hypothetical protein [Pseudodesulfovibrio cashew]|nr:hypothetical protein [Pseudodesulfovibrio cashew]
MPHVMPDDPRHTYVISLLRLALDKTVPEYGDYDLVHHPIPTEQSRSLELVAEGGGIDVVWTMTSIERERDLLPVRIPLQKGLLGYRIFLIRKGRADVFRRVRSLDELRRFVAGQGHDWPDTRILRHNGLRVRTCPRYSLCFGMLAERRFDFFPRGVNEPWGEMREHPGMPFCVEKTILLRYPAPLYFFVNRGNPGLAKRIDTGLRMALADGSFDELFYNHPQMRQVFQKVGFKERRIFDLENPFLPPETPLDDASMWIDLDKLP